MHDTHGKPSLQHRIAARLSGGGSGAVFRGMATLAAGSGVARLIGLASIPILTRLYSPEDFGVMAVFNALIQLLIPLATLRYVMALPLPRNDRTAFALLVLCLGLAACLSVLVGVVLLAGGPVLFAFMSMESLLPFWWLVPLGMIGATGYETLTMWATRQREFRVIARTQIAQSAVGEALKIALGLLMLKPLGLLIGQIAGQGCGSSRLIMSFRPDLAILWHRFRWRQILAAARRYRGFPAYRLPAQLLLVYSIQAPLLFAAYLYDSATTGQLALAIMAVSLPFLLVGQGASRAFYGHVKGLGPSGTTPVLWRVLQVSAVLGGLMALAIHLFGELIFALMFGSDWRFAGELAEILALMLVLQFPASITIELNNITRGQRFFFLVYGVRALGITAAFLAADALRLPVAETMMLYVGFMLIQYALVLTMTISGARRLERAGR
ncbi:MAG: oligosaccharide flippase family protein [Roseovarius sp.]|nr:oligosaccharide flippase family protein [Roseovarius sp.]